MNNKPVKGTGPKTNKKKGSLEKTVVLEDRGKWVQPKSGDKFYINEDAVFPTITFEIETTEGAPYEWSWVLIWPATVSGLKESAKRKKLLKTFSEKGNFKQNQKKWQVNLNGKTIGGTLTVQVKAGNELFKRSVYILGKNPGENRVKELLATIDDVKGFDKLVAQESKFKNFINADGKPIVAFDNGYGLTQMTNPAPSFEQCWNWKENVKGGSSLYKVKQRVAKEYLSQHKRKYTDEQLKLETWSLWNGGNYHIWDSTNNIWRRKPNMLCDSETGNIGWNMSKSDNKDKSEDELHERDKEQYKKPPPKKNRKWDYTGVCYAEHVDK
jgi:hypothetical protein